MITVTVEAERAVIVFPFPLVWAEEDRWRQALEILAEAGPAALLEALECGTEPDERDAWQRAPQAVGT